MQDLVDVLGDPERTRWIVFGLLTFLFILDVRKFYDLNRKLDEAFGELMTVEKTSSQLTFQGGELSDDARRVRNKAITDVAERRRKNTIVSSVEVAVLVRNQRKHEVEQLLNHYISSELAPHESPANWLLAAGIIGVLYTLFNAWQLVSNNSELGPAYQDWLPYGYFHTWVNDAFGLAITTFTFWIIMSLYHMKISKKADRFVVRMQEHICDLVNARPDPADRTLNASETFSTISRAAEQT